MQLRLARSWKQTERDSMLKSTRTLLLLSALGVVAGVGRLAFASQACGGSGICVCTEDVNTISTASNPPCFDFNNGATITIQLYGSDPGCCMDTQCSTPSPCSGQVIVRAQASPGQSCKLQISSPGGYSEAYGSSLRQSVYLELDCAEFALFTVEAASSVVGQLEFYCDYCEAWTE